MHRKCQVFSHFLSHSFPLCLYVHKRSTFQNQTTLCTLITELGFFDDLSAGEWTVFAPTNDAFANTSIDPAYDPADIILFHTVSGQSIFSDDLVCQRPGLLTQMSNGQSTRTLCEENDTLKYQKGQGMCRCTCCIIVYTFCTIAGLCVTTSIPQNVSHYSFFTNLPCLALP